jgi:hypothetical protein
VKKSGLLAALTIVGAAAFATPSFAAVTFDFRAGGNTGGNFNLPSPVPATPFVVGGIGLQGSAGEYNGTSIINTGSRNLTKSDNGLGVDCSGFAGLVCPNETDGNAILNDDLLTIVFDQTVRFISVLFTEVDADDDVDVFVDGVAVGSLTNFSISGLNNPLDLTALTGTSISFGADDASFNNLNEDDFRVGAIKVNAVPVPAALPLFATAMLGVGYIARRRRAQAA